MEDCVFCILFAPFYTILHCKVILFFLNIDCVGEIPVLAAHSAWHDGAKATHSFPTMCPLQDHTLYLGSFCRCPLQK